MRYLQLDSETKQMLRSCIPCAFTKFIQRRLVARIVRRYLETHPKSGVTFFCFLRFFFDDDRIEDVILRVVAIIQGLVFISSQFCRSSFSSSQSVSSQFCSSSFHLGSDSCFQGVRFFRRNWRTLLCLLGRRLEALILTVWLQVFIVGFDDSLESRARGHGVTCHCEFHTAPRRLHKSKLPN